MHFVVELERVLPHDLPSREQVVAKAARHLELIVEANQYLNLTRITSCREAAMKHVLDSIIPWRQFAPAKYVLDAGSGAGFPGVPLAIALPATQFVLAESIQKKARFLESAVGALDLPNVEVEARRAEELTRTHRFDVITARAVAPINRMLGLFAPAVNAGARALFYKGPDADAEMAATAAEAKRRRIRLTIVEQYALPDQFGTRTIVEMSSLPSA